MSNRLNPKVTEQRRSASAHLNWMGGSSWDVSSPLTRLRMVAASCFFGEPQYYHQDKGTKLNRRGYRDPQLSPTQLEYLRSTLDALDPVEWRSLGPTEIMESTIDEALAHDARATLELAAELRNEHFIRVTPQVILVRAANVKALKGTGLVREFAPSIIGRADEVSTQLAYQLARYGKPVPNQLKKAWSDALEQFSEYSLAKYRQASHQVKLVDPANLSHPASDAVNKLMRGELSVESLTWEGLISAKGSSTETWTEALDLMGHMALLRNVRNLIKFDVSPELWLDKLIEGVPNGKQLPFRYLSAYKALEDARVNNPTIFDGLEDCVRASFANSPQFSGRTLSLCDNSGSAWGTTTSEMGTMHIAEIANLSAVVTSFLSDEGHVGVFGDRLETFGVRKTSGVFGQVKKASKLGRNVGASTEHGIWLALDQAIHNAEHWDQIFVYSDMQAGHGGLYGTGGYKDYLWDRGGRHIDVPKLISTYRSKVNPNVNVFLVQVAGYRDTIMPEFYDRTYILGGWGPGLLRFAAAMVRPVQ